MSSLIRRSAAAPPVAPDAELSRRIADAQVPGLLTAARIQSAAFATNIAIQQAGMLSMAVNRAFEMSPAGEHVYNAIFMAYGSVATIEIQRLGLQQGGQS